MVLRIKTLQTSASSIDPIDWKQSADSVAGMLQPKRKKKNW